MSYSRFVNLISIIALIGILNNNSIAQKILLPTSGICAHRGAMNTHPENTLPAFQEAIRLEAKMIELDVRMTKDGKLVIIHDESVDRTTNGKGLVSDLSFEEIRELDAGLWKSQAYKNTEIPTLEEALEVIPRDIWINVHLKGGRQLGTEVAKVLLQRNRLHQAFLACGYEAVIGAKEVAPSILICNMDRQNSTEEYITNTIERKSDFIQLNRVPVNDEIIKQLEVLKKHDIKINYCCSDEPEDVKQLLDYGVDFVLVNELDTIMNYLHYVDREK